MTKQAFLVDDSKSARIVLSRMLKKSGFDGVEMAESGEEALEKLKEATPDAIFVDFLMDGMDGLETITEIKKDPRFNHTPVVMCTANEGDEYVQAAVDHGALGILAKPPTDESIGQIIELIEQHQLSVSPGQSQESAAADTAGQAAGPGLSDEDVRRIAEEVVARTSEGIAREAAGKAVAERLESAVQAYLDEKLEPMVSSMVEQGLQKSAPEPFDSDALRDSVVEQVNEDLDEFVRQLNQRTVGDLIQSSIFNQMNELSSELTGQMKEQEARILSQVPEKNEMIEHIRVITEGSLEAQVHETASRVAGDIANSVATETVENLLDQHLAQQAMENQQEKPKIPLFAILAGGLLAAAGVAAFMFL